MYKDSNWLFMRALPIDYELEAFGDAVEFLTADDDLTWDDIEKKKINRNDSSGMKSKKTVYIIEKPRHSVHRFVVELADLNKAARKKGRIVKPADVKGTTAMMAAMGKKKEKIPSS